MNELQESPCFSGSFAYKEANLKEAAYASLPLYQKILFPVLGVLASASGLYQLYRAQGSMRNYLFAFLSLLLGVWCFIRLSIYCKNYAKRTVKRMNELHQAEPEVLIDLYPDEIITRSTVSEEQQKTTYDHMICLKETKHLILLWRPQRLYHPIEKNKLEGGTVNELKTFLKEKNPNIRMR